MKEPSLILALNSLRPNAEWIMHDLDFSNIEWVDKVQTKPTQEEIDAEIARIESDYESKQYQRNRKYPSIGEQLDMLWHAMDNNEIPRANTFYTAIQTVKNAHPKS